SLSASAQDHNPIGSLLFDIFCLLSIRDSDRMFTRTLLDGLNRKSDRPWCELRKGKQINDVWLARQLRPYGIRPRTIWIGEDHGKGYLLEDFTDAFRRYIPMSEVEAFEAGFRRPPSPSTQKPNNPQPDANSGSF